MGSHSKKVTKGDFLLLTVITLWFLSFLYFTPQILALLIGPENLLAKIFLILFALVINIFWFYGFYHLVVIVFSYFIKKEKIRNEENIKTKPKVALLYTTCNDFKRESVESCLRQKYENFHIFILDDSTEKEVKREIEKFAERNEKITLIRRSDKKGFKAGNINNALRIIKNEGYEYISISDADTILPENYIEGLLKYFTSEEIAFAQAKQTANPKQKSLFARMLNYQIGFHYDRYLKVKEKYGFVMFYGHGALMRLKVIEEIGYFPEIVTEDLAYSMKIREKGYIGVYAEDIICYEDYPSTYKQYRKRNEKWIRGTAECLKKYYPKFFKSDKITLVEKVDVLISAFSLFTSFPFVILLILTGIVLPVFYKEFQFQGVMFRLPLMYSSSDLKYLTNISGNLYWSWDYFIMLLISIVSPIFPAIFELIEKPKERAKYIVMYIFLFYATLIESFLSCLIYMITGRALFPITGEKEKIEIENKIKKYFIKPIANQGITIAVEILFLALFITAGIITQNIWLIIFGIGIMCGTLMLFFEMENTLTKKMIYIPSLLTLLVMFFIAKNL